MSETLCRAWYSWWIWWLYALRLRRPLNVLQRRIAGEHRAPRAPLHNPDGLTSRIRHVRSALARKQWRPDGVRIGGLFIPLDYVSAPEVTQARLNSDELHDGDCDDLHHWAAVILEQVSTAYHVSIGYRGGGHVACVYQLAGGSWWLLNYGVVLPLEHPRDACGLLLKWASRVHGHDVGPGRWFVFETPALKRVRL